jgi:hypothetical protein
MYINRWGKTIVVLSGWKTKVLDNYVLMKTLEFKPQKMMILVLRDGGATRMER